MNRMKRTLLGVGGWLGMVLVISAAWGQTPRELRDGFRNPPDTTKPWVYWYWISDNISKEGITRDLESMQRIGIGEALIGNIYLDDVEIGDVKALTDEWWGMVAHAIREGGRLGVDIGMFNCPGWSQSGGPWIKPEQSMRYLVSTEVRVAGPSRFDGLIGAPAEEFQDVALLAFPAPPADAATVAALEPAVGVEPVLADAARLFDKRFDRAVMFPEGVGRVVIDVETASAFTARSLILNLSETAFACNCVLQAADGAGGYRTIREFRVDRSNTSINVGFMPHAPVAVSFPVEHARKYRLIVEGISGRAGFTEIELLTAPRLDRFMEKQLAKMHPTPLPMWDTYLWDLQPALDDAGLAMQVEAVLDLTGKLDTDGRLEWEVPQGEWVILRMGMSPTGTKNAPASPEGQGLEVDKMNRAAARAHFDAYIGELLRRMPAEDRRAFKHVVADSYEMGSQNWTDGFDARFRAQFGYDPTPWLPVLTGRIVESADASERFLWDMRRMVADGVAYEYVGGLREISNEHGLKLWLENYGHWGFPAEFLQYGGQADQVSGEFWATGDLGSIELRAAASAAHVYGKPIVSAEAFTSGQRFESTPWSLKPRGDWALTEGINHWVMHVYIHQPWEDRLPGVNAWFSTEFNRHNTWFEQTREWIDYYRRCHYLLQQGAHVADVAYFIGDDTPKMTGVREPELPDGYDYDYINGEVIRERLEVRDGRFVLPDGKSYRVLVLPQLRTMRPEVLQRIVELVRAGGVVLGPRPEQSPSLADWPAADAQVRDSAAELWGDCDGLDVTQRRFGEGMLFNGVSLETVFAAIGLVPDVDECPGDPVLWTHRTTGEAEIFFVTNQSSQPVSLAPLFRGPGLVPELWDPERNQIRRPGLFAPLAQGVRVPIELEPYGSTFVVLGRGRAREAVSRILKDGEVIGSTEPKVRALEAGDDEVAPGNFVLAGWVLPQVEIGLPGEVAKGVFLGESRNDVIDPTHGDSIVAGGGHAGAGLAVGRNGVVVYEHGANHFASVLVHRAPLTEWTHLALVYRAGRPVLYVNGELAREGVSSGFTVHPGRVAGSGFKGGCSDFLQKDGVLARADLERWLAAGPPKVLKSVLPVIALERRGREGGVEAVVSEAGRYELQWTDGGSAAFEATELPAAVALAGPWRVRFRDGRGAPDVIELPVLQSLTEWPLEAVRYYSGTAVYERSFEMSPERLDSSLRYYLALGEVASIAEVRVNGVELGVYWKPPYVVELTDILVPGDNRLEVSVTSTWRNRLIGDAKHPAGLPGAEGAPFQTYLTADIGISPNETPAPYGLLGPVTLQGARVIPVPRP